MITRVVVVGAGQAGLQVATSLRELGFDGSIQLIGEESHPPYQRPPLSKAFLSGSTDESHLFMQESSFFQEQDIGYLGGETVTAIEREMSRLDLASGISLPYDHLVLATGARNRMLPCTGGELSGVISLRTLDDAHELKAALAHARHIAVIGAGFLGLEAASVAIAQGCTVRVVEAADRVLARAVSPPMSQVVLRCHEANGVKFEFNDTVVALHDHDGKVDGIELRQGGIIPADLVLVSIGVVPNTELAAAAGLEVHNGIVVDNLMLTEDPAISAIGDCAAFPFAADGDRTVRVESVQNAADQARLVARRLMGDHTPYDQVPLFWSDQAGLRLQMAGLTRGDEQHVVRGNTEAPAFSVYCFRDDRLVGVESVNRLPDHMLARKLLRANISPTARQAQDTSFDLKSLLQQGAAA